MPFPVITDARTLVRSLNAFAFGPDTPDIISERLQSIPGTDADRICEGAELLYAYYDILPDSGKIVTGQLFAYGSLSHWAAFNADGRCDKIVAKVRRDLGEEGEWPDASDDPEPQANRREEGFNWKTDPPLDDPNPEV